ncbi:MAG: pyruvate ferredoxin oxidoreductase [Candidatus Doudnabacteria bacterium]|nr:pyruvate ferredoxin oxidoreductase [Candidatus Doudnabacteria bacterium]
MPPSHKKVPQNPANLLSPGHSACGGCGELLAARHVAEALGKKAIIANATGCLEVTTSKYPMSAWNHPWIHSLFENPGAVASGILAALKQQGKEDIAVVAQAGDGGTFDIGLGLISGAWEREENILVICYDNEAYMNTGYQGSGATPHDAATTTTPAGKYSWGNPLYKKNMPAIALAHKCVYVATSTVGYPLDIQAKVKKALTFKGPKYIQIHCPCVPGWQYDSRLTVKLAKLSHRTGLYPVFEAEYGKRTTVMPLPKDRPPVEEYLKHQRRFKHLFASDAGKKEIAVIQKIADENINRIKN